MNTAHHDDPTSGPDNFEPFDDTITWHLTYATRSYWPHELPDTGPVPGTGTTADWLAAHRRFEHWLETIAQWHARTAGDFHAEYLTDQYNVYRGRELIAVYMVA